MNDHDIEKLLGDAGRSAKKVGMTVAEKDRHRSRLMQFMEKAGTLPAPADIRAVKPNLWTSLLRKLNPAYIAAPVLVILGAGVVYAAEGSLPGDLLYGLKTNVIERVQTSLAFSAEDKANLNAQFAVKRLVEAEAVSKKHNLDPSKKLELSKDFAQKKDDLLKEIQTLKNENKSTEADKIYNDFSSRLQEHRLILTDIQDAGNTENKTVPNGTLGESTTQETSTTTRTLQEQMASQEVKIRYDQQSFSPTTTGIKTSDTTSTTGIKTTDFTTSTKTGDTTPIEIKTTDIKTTDSGTTVPSTTTSDFRTTSTAPSTQETAVR